MRLLNYPRPDKVQRIALGSAESLRNDLLQTEVYGNGDLLVQVFGWLAQRQAPVGIIPEQLAPYSLQADDDQLHWVLVILVAFLPATCVGIGILAWWERR